MQMDEKIMAMLMELLQRTAIIEAKLDAIEEIKTDTKGLNMRIEKIEMMNERHEDTIKKLENRCNAMEQYTRNSLNEAKKQQTSIFISIGMAIFSSILSFIFAMFK